MDNYFKLDQSNSTLNWDESAYSLFYHLYNIESCPENHSSFVNNGTYGDKEGDWLNAQFQFYIEGIGVLIFTLLGILGNSVSAWILFRPQMRTPINCILLGLAVADTLFIAMNILILAIPTILTHSKVNFSLLVILTPILFPVAAMAHLSSVYLTLAVTIERYIAVCHPFWARSKFTWRQARCIVIGIMIYSMIYNISRWWEYVCVGIVDNNGNLVRYVPITTNLRRNPLYQKYFVYMAYFILVYTLPLIILILFNSLIYRAVKKANLQRRMLTSSEKNENQLARMLVMVVLVFILCNAMPLVNLVTFAIAGSPSVIGVDSLRNFSIILNSCINFVIYCTYGEKFRDIFVNLWPKSVRNYCCKDAFSSRQSCSNSSRSNSCEKVRPLSFSTTMRTTSFVIDAKLKETT